MRRETTPLAAKAMVVMRPKWWMRKPMRLVPMTKLTPETR